MADAHAPSGFGTMGIRRTIARLSGR